jgi:uncharacterized coiled-coil protein SlyX
MSEEKVTLELLGARTLTLMADVRDMQLRMGSIEARIGALEQRFSALESAVGAFGSRLTAIEYRFTAQEERMTRMMALLVQIAERVVGRQEEQ